MKKSIIYLVLGILVINVGVLSVSLIQQNGQLAAANNELKTAKENILVLNNELSTVRGTVFLLQSRLDASQNNNAILQERAAAAEENVTALQGVLAYTNLQYAKSLSSPSLNVTVQPNNDPFQFGNITNDHGAGMGQ